MKLTVERLPESQVRLDIAAEDAEFGEAMERAYRKVSREIVVPGFRKGKVPRSMIESRFGREIFLEEAHKTIMDDLYRKALKQESLVPVGDPNVVITEPDPIAFTVTVPVYPSIEPGPYQDVRVEPSEATLDEGAVDEVIERLRLRSSPWVDPAEPRKPTEGDQVTVDLEMTTEDGEPFQDPIEDSVFVLGESQLFEPLRAAIESLDVGETTETTIAFEEDDESATERLRGRMLTYKVTLTGVKEREMLPLDDEFARTYAEEESMEVLREAIREDLHRTKSDETRSEVLESVIAKIGEGATLDIPAPMIDEAAEEEIGRMRQRLQYQRQTLESYLRANDQTEAELRLELRPAVARRLRNSMILREIAEREGITVTDADLEAELDKITANAPDPEQARKIYSSDRYMSTVIHNDLFDTKLTNRILEIATEGRGAVVGGWIEPEGGSRRSRGKSAPRGAPEIDGDIIDVTPTSAIGDPEAEVSPPAEGSESGESAGSSVADLADAMTGASADADETTAASHGAANLIDAMAGASAATGETTATTEGAAPVAGAPAGSIPGDGSHACPESHAIKGNAGSMIYHLPGQRSYDQTIPEVCFGSEDDAVSAGYRASKAGVEPAG